MGPKYYIRGYQLDDNNEEVTEYKDIKSGFTDFATTHGIPHIARATGIIKKGVWLLVTLTCFAGLGYNFYAITATYTSYPVYVHSTIKQSQGITFPAVSICNSNPVKKSAVSNNERLQALLASWESTKKRRKKRDEGVCVSDSLEKASISQDEISGDLLTKFQLTKKRRRKRQTSYCPNPTHNDICYWKHCEESAWGCAKKSFADASTICQDEGGILAVVDTQAKQDHIARILNLDSNDENLWIDLVYDPSESDWIWSETSQLGSNWNYWDPDPGTPTDNTCACTSNSKWETNVCEIVLAWSGSFFGCDPLCQDNRPDEPISTTEEVTTMVTTEATTTVPETTTQTTTVPETTTQTTTIPETTTQTTTVPETTTQTTTVPETTTQTTTVPETTTQTTTVPETTTQTTTVPETTTQTTTVPETTTQTTTMPETTTQTTTMPETTAETTTVPETTTQITTVPETTTQTTTVPETTTQTTTVPETTTETTTLPETTTQTTTVPETTTQTTTVPETTTETTTMPETTTQTTTMPETTAETTTVPETTTQITTVPETTTQTTTVPETTTETTTLPETTTQTTTVPETTTQTTTVPETTTETTTMPETTTQTTTMPETTAETTTVPETTTQITTVPETTTQTTTVPETTTQTTTVPETTTETTTLPETTTQTTTVPETTAETTTVPEKTTESPTVPETTTESTTVLETTTTIKPTTTYYSAYPDRDPPREDYQRESDFMEVLADISLDEKKSMGYNYPEFILECVYNGNRCSESQFEHFFDATHGNCYAFNSGWNSSQPLETSFYTGRTKGLHLYVNLGQYEYIESVSEGAGAIVVVNNQSSMPFPSDVGILAPPGYITSVGIRKLEVHRLGDNYGDCVQRDDQGVEKNMFTDEHPVKYTFAACHKTCYQKHVIGTCGCADPQYPINSQAFGDVTVSPCDARNQTQDDCVYGLTLLFIQDELDCSCELPCLNQYFGHSISKIIWPSDKEKETVINRYHSVLDNVSNVMLDEQYVKRNFLKLEVYFEELNSEYMEEKPKYNFARYISDVGSIIGLWLGCSVFSILEFLELGLDTLVYSVIHCKRKRVRMSDSMTSLLSRHTKRKTSPAAIHHNNSEKPLKQNAWNDRRIFVRGKPGPSFQEEVSNISRPSPYYKDPADGGRCSSIDLDEGYTSRESSFTTDSPTNSTSVHALPRHRKFVLGDSQRNNSTTTMTLIVI